MNGRARRERDGQTLTRSNSTQMPEDEEETAKDDKNIEGIIHTTPRKRKLEDEKEEEEKNKERKIDANILEDPRRRKISLIVFDIDETLVTRMEDNNNSDEQGFLVTYEKDNTCYEGFYQQIPGCSELLRYVYSEKNVPFAFFSAGSSERNEIIVEIILQLVFPEKVKEILDTTLIFSVDDIHLRVDKIREKDLSLVVDRYKAKFKQDIDLENVLLIDDSFNYRAGTQNVLPVPYFRSRTKLLSVMGVLDELLTSPLTPSEYLSSFYTHYVEDGIWKKQLYREIPFYAEKGLEVFKRINPKFTIEATDEEEIEEVS
jgi:hypothetical protein